MLPSVRANFDSSPFIAYFHTLFLVFFESPFFGFRRRSPSRSHRETAGHRREINLLYPLFRSLFLLSRVSRNTPYIRIILPTAFI